MSNSNTWIIRFNECGTDSITCLDGRRSLEAVHAQAMKHYKAVQKLKGSYSHQYGIGKGVLPSQVNTKQFVIAEY